MKRTRCSRPTGPWGTPPTRPRAHVIAFAALTMMAACDVPNAADWERLDTARTPAPEPWASDLAYGTDSPNQVVDIYTPTAPSNGGLVAFVHGGGWVVGNENDVPPIALHWLADGWIVASIRYRLGGEAAWPAQRNDVQLATAWLRQATDSTTVVVLGHSAGGHIATAAAVTPPIVAGGQPDGVIAMSAPFDPLVFAQTTSLPKGTMDLVMNKTFGCPPGDWTGCNSPQLQDAMLPSAGDPTDPPMYIAAGDHDTTGPWDGQEPTATALESAIGYTKVWIDVVDNGPLEWRQHELDGALNLRQLERWMADRLGGGRPTA